MLFQSCLPKHFWSYVVLHAAYLINMVPSKVLDDKTPYEVLHGSLPDLSQLKDLVAYALLQLYNLIDQSLILDQGNMSFSCTNQE